MKVLYNSRLLSDSSISLELDNRAFCYGDGLFETIVTGPDRINLIEYHFDRLKRGCEKLSIQMPLQNATELINIIDQLVEENEMTGDIRAKLQVWRQSGGLYTPEQKGSNFLLKVNNNEANKFYNQIGSISDCQSSQLVYSQISDVKTLNALPYILAGIEKNKGNFNDLIIKNEKDQIVEMIASNIFWVKDAIIYTPSLKSGCIDGVMRRFLLKQFQSNKIECHEVLAQSNVLFDAQSIFLTNVNGIKWVKNYGASIFEDPKEFLYQSIKLQQLL
jgi:branched-chain amino acid aminotransferase/4-amino-4-deoxychorismate lyase